MKFFVNKSSVKWKLILSGQWEFLFLRFTSLLEKLTCSLRFLRDPSCHETLFLPKCTEWRKNYLKNSEWLWLSKHILMCVLSCSIVSDTLQPQGTPWSLPGSSVHGVFPRQKYWSGLPFPPPEDLSDPVVKPVSPAIAGGFLTTESNSWTCAKHTKLC